MYIVVILLGTSVGASTSAEAFLKMSTLKIVFLGLVAFAVGTAAGVLFGKLMSWDPTNFLMMNAMGPNVAGVIGTAVAAGTFLAIFGI